MKNIKIAQFLKLNELHKNKETFEYSIKDKHKSLQLSMWQIPGLWNCKYLTEVPEDPTLVVEGTGRK